MKYYFNFYVMLTDSPSTVIPILVDVVKLCANSDEIFLFFLGYVQTVLRCELNGLYGS